MHNKIAIAGFGMEGRAVYAYLKDAHDITIFDEREPKDLPEGVPFVQSLSIPPEFDIVYKSPGIPTGKLSVASTTRISTLMDIVLERAHDRSIGITGTKGKSTVASLIQYILSTSGRDSVLLGNIGVADMDLLKDSPDRTYVLELSSYQCEHLTRSPHIAILTNLYPEHLTHHGSFDAYREAKLNIARFQNSGDLFINGSELQTEFDGKVIVPDAGLQFETKLLGEHNQKNCAIAFAAAIAAGVSEDVARAAIATFEPLPYRLEEVGTYEGITFYDDSLATVPEATSASIQALPRVDTLILGGEDRGIPFDAFAEELAKSSIGTLIAFPDTGAKMVAKAAPERVVHASSMEEAVRVAYERTPKDGVVLLSNASPSFTMFTDYKDKSAQYRKWIEALAGSMVKP